MTIRRVFIDLPDGQLHYRRAGPVTGTASPIFLLHASPGSSRQLVPLIAGLAERYDVVAPDTPGNGDSTPLPIAAPTIADYAARLPALLDALGLDRVAVYGSHTGAAIAVELAILAPDRVDRLILDGIGIFTPEQRDEQLARYAPAFTPDLDGGYLMRAFQFCRDQYLFYPWYDRTRTGRRDGGVRPAADLHAWLVEVLKAAETYPLAYHAAFAWDAVVRLPLAEQRMLLLAAEDDPLAEVTRDAERLVAEGRFVALPRYDAPHFGPRRIALIAQFLADRA
ncbi:alpha/beta hydrolase [Sphingomonas sp. 4RDLI-65]|uniref:alpha/beta fold hydrolase n=1 Tax=Sphingomonas sp. 4RDLI-65 TaxID=3111641 RepID=UPI003C21DAF8